MAYIFIDESGDLGNKKSSSKYFVIVGVKVDDDKKLDRVIKKLEEILKKILLLPMKLRRLICIKT